MSSSGGSSPEVPVAQTFKVIVLGDSGVGKTSLIHFYKQGVVPPNMISTIGIDYSDIIISVRGIKVKLRVWDTAGQERFHTFTKQFFRGAQGILLVYDITSHRSFNMLSKWLRMLSESGLENIDMVLVGNKIDLEDRREVPMQLAQQLSKDQGCFHIQTSAFNGTEVRKAFYKLAESLIHSYNIFIPGLEAAAMYEDSDESSHKSKRKSVNHCIEQRSDSIVLSREILEEKKRKKACCKNV